eukprot:11999874-Alexandrium_andersonii.AAC.1
MDSKWTLAPRFLSATTAGPVRGLFTWGVQATPIRAWRAARNHVWPFCSQDANDTIAILGL